MKELPKDYDHKVVEKKWQEAWELEKIYAWNSSEPRENNYVIDTPPPTVSGLLHMGHIFSYTQADFIARFQRMIGKNVFYPMGFDDNGLPTERLVEKIKGKKAAQYESREAFIKECQEVVKEAEEDFRKLFKSAALSVDWSQEYQTISEESRKISQMSFLDLYKKNHVYRALEPMLWDPVDQTAIAQAEVVDKELASAENFIKFGLVKKGTFDKVGEITIMTTRPELIPACVAVMCDESDIEKYKNMEALTPLFNVRVPIIADEKVDKEKGTGLVMCCTFGDETDIYWWKKHKLNTKVILNKYGKIDAAELEKVTEKNDFTEKLANKKTTNPDPKNQGAREIILDLLKAENLLTEQKLIKHMVKCAERSGAALEIIPTYQWFVKVLDKKAALKQKANECEWHPEFMKIRMEQWIDGLNWDWCISRQRYFGVPFPVWFIQEIISQERFADKTKLGAAFIGTRYELGEIEMIHATIEMLPTNPLDEEDTKRVFKNEGYKFISSDALGLETGESSKSTWNWIVEKEGKKFVVTPDNDVMDTWATSSVSPQLSSKGISENFCLDLARHEKLFPADLRPQAHEIIRTWAFYTIVKAHLHEDKIPWKNLMISGWCLASDKTKMSKSKGNVITPVALIEEKGTDAVRYWASTSRLGQDTAFSEDLLKIGRKLVTKIFNAAKFTSIQFPSLKAKPVSAAVDVRNGIIYEALDLWILTRLRRAVEKATKEFTFYEYSDARVAIEDFFWNDFCDNYLEMVKTRAYAENAEQGKNKSQQSALHTLYHCLETILHLFAPFVPHITEEIFAHIFSEKFAKEKSIHARGSWPKIEEHVSDRGAEQAGIYAREILDFVRKVKAEAGVSIKTPLSYLHIAAGSENGREDEIKSVFADLAGVTAAAKLEWKNGEASGKIFETSDKKFKIHIMLGAQ
jgi:valyl-tRNA synthetase